MKLGIRIVWFILLLVGVASFPALVSAIRQAQLVEASTFKPVADAYVDSASPEANYGGSRELLVNGNPEAWSYLSFDLSGVNQPVTWARLRIYANSASSSGISIWSVNNPDWNEQEITYQDAPAVGSQAAVSGPFRADSWLELDVTSLVREGQPLHLAISAFGDTPISLASREAGGKAPRLVISTRATPTPVTLLAAGDIALCGNPPTSPGPEAGARITSDMLLAEPGLIFTLGDNSNEIGSAENYANCYSRTWGQFKGRTYPAMGNHDQYADPQGGPYFAYFGSLAGDSGHYSLDLGDWHIIVLNSNCAVGEQGCEPGSPQENWLLNDLAATQQKCILALWHMPLFTSGTQAPNIGMRAFWQDLYNARADLILNGHNHIYERFAPQDPDGQLTEDGIREFVVGTGGAYLDPSDLPLAANQEIRNSDSFGYLKLTLRSGGYDWQFVSEPGQPFTDSGSAECH